MPRTRATLRANGSGRVTQQAAPPPAPSPPTLAPALVRTDTASAAFPPPTPALDSSLPSASSHEEDSSNVDSMDVVPEEGQATETVSPDPIPVSVKRAPFVRDVIMAQSFGESEISSDTIRANGDLRVLCVRPLAGCSEATRDTAMYALYASLQGPMRRGEIDAGFIDRKRIHLSQTRAAKAERRRLNRLKNLEKRPPAAAKTPEEMAAEKEKKRAYNQRPEVKAKKREQTKFRNQMMRALLKANPSLKSADPSVFSRLSIQLK